MVETGKARTIMPRAGPWPSWAAAAMRCIAARFAGTSRDELNVESSCSTNLSRASELYGETAGFAPGGRRKTDERPGGAGDAAADGAAAKLEESAAGGGAGGGEGTEGGGEASRGGEFGAVAGAERDSRPITSRMKSSRKLSGSGAGAGGGATDAAGGDDGSGRGVDAGGGEGREAGGAMVGCGAVAVLVGGAGGGFGGSQYRLNAVIVLSTWRRIDSPSGNRPIA